MTRPTNGAVVMGKKLLPAMNWATMSLGGAATVALFWEFEAAPWTLVYRWLAPSVMTPKAQQYFGGK